MKIYNKHTTGAEQTHFRFYDFDQYQNEQDFIFIDSPQIFSEIPKEIFKQKIIYLEMEEPNRFFTNVEWFNHFSYDQYFNKILSICPFTSKWLNHQSVFLPIKWEPTKNDKLYDIIYSGHIYPGGIENNVSILKNFNYRIVSNTEHHLTTDKSVSHKDKLKLISQSKITLVHNLLYPTLEHINNVKTLNDYQNNEAFSKLDNEIVPQMKSRALEAAMCKSLILCQRDPWNVIENYFEPNKEFVYYDKENAKEQIQNILDNYNDYLPIIENAYIKAQNYTTEAFFNKYLKDLQL